MLRFPTPSLEDLCVLGKDRPENQWRPNLPSFLPFCPSLRQLRSDFCNIVPSASARGLTGPLNSLVNLELCVDIPCKDVVDILRRTPHLEVLNLQSSVEHFDGDDDIMFSSPIALLRLTDLTTFDHYCDMIAANAAELSLPALKRLHISHEHLAALQPLFQHVRNTLRYLKINGGSPLQDTDAELIAPLAQVEELAFESSRLTDSFLGPLSRQRDDGWVLPKLATISLQKGTKVDDDVGDSLIRLIRARNAAPASDSSELHGTARVRAVLVVSDQIPPWLDAQMRILLT